MFAGTNAVGLVVQGIILSWILKIEKKCDCSKDWRRDYIKYVSIINIALTFLMLFLITFMRQKLINGITGLGARGVKAMGVVAALAVLVNLISILTYIPDLKKRDCTCALENDWRDNFIFWWMLIGTILMFIVPAIVVTKKLTQ
jgi:magnesium-transporting ATPase (P-type)